MTGIDEEDDINSWQDSVLQQIANLLFQHRVHIQSAFRMFDVDNSGTVTAEEFKEGFRRIQQDGQYGNVVNALKGIVARNAFAL